MKNQITVNGKTYVGEPEIKIGCCTGSTCQPNPMPRNLYPGVM